MENIDIDIDIDKDILENIDIDIDIDKDILENIDIDIDIDKDILENIDIDIDIDKSILENIDIDIDIDKFILGNIDMDKDILGRKIDFFSRFGPFFMLFWWNIDIDCRYIGIFWNIDKISTLIMRISISTKYWLEFFENIDIDENIDREI